MACRQRKGIEGQIDGGIGYAGIDMELKTSGGGVGGRLVPRRGKLNRDRCGLRDEEMTPGEGEEYGQRGYCPEEGNGVAGI